MGARERASGLLRSLLAPWRHRPPPLIVPDDEPAERSSLPLDEVRRRLELLVAAVYGQPIPIVPATPPAAPRPPRRLLRRAPPPPAPPPPVAANDGERIHLPPELELAGGDEAALARYRLLAVEQAERLARGTALLAPPESAPLERDLYLLMESAAVDAAIARTVPGVLPALAAERAAALARRPAPETLTPAEREVEALVRRLLSADPATPPPELEGGAVPEDSLAAARALAARVGGAGQPYRGLPSVGAWGTVLPAAGTARPLRTADYRTMPGSRYGVGKLGSGPNPGNQESPRGQTPGLRPSADGPPQDPNSPPRPDAGGADSGAPNTGDPPPGAPPQAGAGAAGDPSTLRETAAGSAAPSAPDAPAGGVPYPEWDHQTGRYRPQGAFVRTLPAFDADEGWAVQVLERHPALVRRLRERFERLRARRVRLSQQRDGDELDLAACVRALVDLRTGHTVDDRLYASVRPARRGLAICLLVDVSGSTSEPLGSQRVIDIEKVALLLTSEALDALGDLYAVLTFSGTGAGDVRLRTLKDFAEPNGKTVRRRIAALRPEGYTRLGAAIRHATAQLAGQQAGHRLLLIISDGKPNDIDFYQGRYGIEDSRQSIAEARAAGVFPFCLTVDRRGADYLTRIFGKPGHMILRDPDQLPLALVGVVRQLLRTG